MGGGSGGGGGTTTTKSKPWGQAIPDLQDILGQAKTVGNTPTSYYPDSTVTPQLQSSQTALQDIMQRGMAGSPVTDAAQGNIAGTLNGDYLSAGNPYFQNVAQNTINATLPALNSTFGLAGRTGSGLHQEAVSEGLGNAIGNLAYGNYSDERNRQQQALGLAPSIANQDYTDLGNALGASQQQEQYNQQQLTDAVNRYNYGQQEPAQRLGQYAGVVTPIGGLGGTQSTTTPSQGGLLSGLLGTALLGVNGASQLGWKPLGAGGAGSAASSAASFAPWLMGL